MFKAKPFYLDDNLKIPYPSSYLFYNIAYDKPLIVNFNSGTLQQGWTTSVPLANPIESTMAWLDEVARDQFIPYITDPLLSTNGFKWKRYNGQNIEEFIPGNEGIKGYPWHVSGVWNQIEDIHDFTKKYTLIDPNYGAMNATQAYSLYQHWNSQFGINGQVQHSKLDKGFYHHYVPNLYKAIPVMGCQAIHSRFSPPQIITPVSSTYTFTPIISSYSSTIMESGYNNDRTVINDNNSYITEEVFLVFNQLTLGTGSSFVYNLELLYPYTSYNVISSGYKSNVQKSMAFFGGNDGYYGSFGKYEATTSAGIDYKQSGTDQIFNKIDYTTEYIASRQVANLALFYPLRHFGNISPGFGKQLPWILNNTNIISSSVSTFHTSTGMDSAHIYTTIRKYRDFLSTTSENHLLKPTLENGGNPIPYVSGLPESNFSLEYHIPLLDLKPVYGFTTTKSILQEIKSKNYTALPTYNLSLVSSGTNKCIPQGQPNRPELSLPTEMEYISLGDSYYFIKTPGYDDYIFDCDISPALTAIPPISSYYLFIALISEPFAAISSFIDFTYPPIININPVLKRIGGGLLPHIGLGISARAIAINANIYRAVSSIALEPSSTRDLIAITNDIGLNKLNPRNGIDYNFAGAPCSFDIHYPYHGYSLAVTPGFMANGVGSGLITNSITGASFSGLVPRFGTMYGF